MELFLLFTHNDEKITRPFLFIFCFYRCNGTTSPPHRINNAKGSGYAYAPP